MNVVPPKEELEDLQSLLSDVLEENARKAMEIEFCRLKKWL